MHAHLKILTVCLKIIVKDLSIIILFVQNKISIITLFSTKWTVDMNATQYLVKLPFGKYIVLVFLVQ